MVTRYDPFRDFDALASRLLSQASDMGQAMRAMPVDLFRSGDHYVLLCDLPGVDPGSVDVGVDGRVLTIRAQRSARAEDVEWLTRERPTGTFVRQLTLGPGLDLDRIEAAYNDGVLSLTLPVAEQAKPRRIEIAHGSAGQQMITGTARETTGSAQGASETVQGTAGPAQGADG
jgi:HSP20 family protein